MDRGDGFGAGVAHLAKTRVGGVRLGQRAFPIDRQPGVDRAVLPLGIGDVRRNEIARGDLARPQPGRHLERGEPGEVRAWHAD